MSNKLREAFETRAAARWVFSVAFVNRYATALCLALAKAIWLQRAKP